MWKPFIMVLDQEWLHSSSTLIQLLQYFCKLEHEVTLWFLLTNVFKCRKNRTQSYVKARNPQFLLTGDRNLIYRVKITGFKTQYICYVTPKCNPTHIHTYPWGLPKCILLGQILAKSGQIGSKWALGVFPNFGTSIIWFRTLKNIQNHLSFRPQFTKTVCHFLGTVH